MKCLYAIYVDWNQQTYFGTNDVICHVIWHHLSFLTYHFSILMMWVVDSTDHVTCKWLPTIKVCTCVMSSNRPVWLQMIFCSCINETMLFSSLQGSLMRENGRSLCFPKKFWLKKKLGNRTCLTDQCLADQLFLCSPLKHHDIFQLPSSVIIVNCVSLKD